jgi:hypothetical protein
VLPRSSRSRTTDPAGYPSDNRLENLEVLPRAEHQRIHGDRLRVRSLTERIVLGDRQRA